ncbi:hypothetical protein GCM10011496_33060 [Polaromonas eurypsychrophila]|uniref:Sulfotransferase family protein n=2 Tax=Polaromonas eurypsychrophila TaxID=1614635 RepID=A0A916WKT5_9BURK|nr:hypothetical protein GCM10011496_33060 [Polaromonas eurypsychrophila]
MSVSAKCIFVLGMHRSGTSALTGLLCQFGAIAGKDLLPANDSNPKGFFESRAVVDLNNAILQAAGSSWDDMQALPVDWQRPPEMQPLRSDIAALFSSLFVAEGLRVIKDPRLSKTLPLWLDVLMEFGVQPVVVICVREPGTVAQSEKLMKGFPSLKSLLLYLDYGLHAELHSRNVTRTIVAYSDLLADWQGVLKRVDEELGLGLPLEAPGLAARGADFISPGLNRSQLDVGEFQRCGTLAEMAHTLYEALRVPNANEIDVLRQRFIAYQGDMQPWGVVLQHVQAIEERFPNVDLGQRFSYPRMQSRLSWTDTLAAEFDLANVVLSNWVYRAGRQSVHLSFDRRCVVEKFRLTFVNRPAYVRVHSLVLRQGSAVLGRWEHIREWLIGQSDSAFDLTDRANDAIDAWLFLDSKSYVDIKLPGNQRLSLDLHCHLDLDIEVADSSAAVNPLLAKLGQLSAEVIKLRKQWQARATKPAKEKHVFALVSDLTDLHGLLQQGLQMRDQKIVAQQHLFDHMREDLLRAEAQLDLLKDVMIGNLDDDPF